MAADISVVLPTFDREAMLLRALGSLRGQTLGHDQFEVVVVDDGSSDATPTVCQELMREWHELSYQYIPHAGLAVAKNAGVLAAGAPIVLFLDDDDVFASDLLEAHLRVHDRHRDDSLAVLGTTLWEPTLVVTPLMRYVTEIGQQLFSYPGIVSDRPLDFTHFWGGRTSCRRQFLLDHGLFNPRFTSIIEDLELGYRLSRHGLRVRYEPAARIYMARELTFEDFVARSERRGRALALFDFLYDDPSVSAFCRIDEQLCLSETTAALLGERVSRIAELERLAQEDGGGREEIDELYALYGWAFAAYEARGSAAAVRELSLA